MTRIGLIADTHGMLDKRAVRAFETAGVTRILHAGDIGPASILYELEAVAPVTAVRGNNDFEVAGWTPLTNLVRMHIAGREVVLVHDYTRAMTAAPGGLLVCGHTHRPLCEHDPANDTWVLNPGSATRPRTEDGLPTVAVLELAATGEPHMELRYLEGQ